MKIENLYTSAACNRTSNAVDWNVSRNIIAFGSCNNVALAQAEGGSWQIFRILCGHQGNVNALKWVKSRSEDNAFILVSASDDGTIIVWTFSNLEDIPISIVLDSGQNCGISNVDALLGETGQLTIVGGFKDTFAVVWKKQREVMIRESLNLGRGFCLAVRIAQFLTSGSHILLVGTSENKINLYVDSREGENNLFQLKKILIGHVDWIRGIDLSIDGEELIIATSSQDNYIRLWRVSEFKAPLSNGIEEGSNNIEKLKFRHYNDTFQVVLESVLKGHDGWVYSVQLSRNFQGSLQLLSTSIDKSVVIWTQSNGLWLEDVRLGNLGGQMGFLTGQFGEHCNSVLTHNFQGCLQMWQKDHNDQNWRVTCTFGGHFGAVRDIAWEPLGDYLFSMSADQTTRIHGQWKHDNCATWHEIARPQIHGYDLQAIAPLTRFRFLSAAEEKIIRCFQAPTSFGKNFQVICKPYEDDELKKLVSSNVAGVTLSALGLSAQASDTETVVQGNEVLQGPPTEEYLKQNSLWVEFQKLYGHGYDVYALAVNSDGKILASSCKANNTEHAKVILWDTKTWHSIQNLYVHQLTVTQIRFSPDNTKLLLVSRDRRFSVFEKLTADSEKFTCTAISDKTNGIHTRIIWCCGWSHDSSVFATGSRDGKLVVWKKTECENGSLGLYNAMALHNFKDDSITALDFAGQFVQEKFFMAIGFESGKINLCSLDNNLEVIHSIDNSNAHTLTVKSLRFRPGKDRLQLASCGDDHLVRIFDIVK